MGLYLDTTSIVIIGLCLLMVLASLGLVALIHQADRENKRLRKRIAELERQPDRPAPEAGQFTPYDSRSDKTAL